MLGSETNYERAPERGEDDKNADGNASTNSLIDKDEKKAGPSWKGIPGRGVQLSVIGEHSPRNDDDDGDDIGTGYRRIDQNGDEARNFVTIDWFVDRDLARKKKRAFRERNLSRTCGNCSNWCWNIQGWTVLFLVGGASALTGSVVHQIATWLSGLKFGYCRGHGFWVSRSLCCLESKHVTCEAWANWSEILAPGAPGGFWLDYVVYVTMGVTLASASSYICSMYSPLSLGSGVAGTKVVLGGFIIKNFLSAGTLLIKSVGLVLAVASGLSLGLQGPLVHIACCWGSIFVGMFTKYKENEAMKREIYSASCAAGVTAAFGAPLGGVLFSLEAMSSYFPPKTMWRSFWCAISTAVFLRYFNPNGNGTESAAGKLVQFQVFYKGESWMWFELGFFAILGVLGGLAGALFVRINSKLHQIRGGVSWFKNHRLLEIAIITTITCVIAFSNVFAAEGQTFLLEHLFNHCTELKSSLDDKQTDALCTTDGTRKWKMILLLLAAGVGRYILTIVTFGSQVPSGLFMPTLVVGACVGRALGWMVESWHLSVGDVYPFEGCIGRTDCIFPSLYAVAGSAAFLGGATRLTVSLSVIMLELTGGLDYIVPLMVAVVPAKWVGDAFGKEGIFDKLISLQGYPHINPVIELESTATAASLMSSTVIALTKYGETVESLEEMCSQYTFHGFPIIEARLNRQVVGFITRRDIKRALKQSDDDAGQFSMRVAFASENVPGRFVDYVDLSKYVDRHPVIVRPSMPADRVLDMFKGLGLRCIFVCSSDGSLRGVIKKKDMLKHINDDRKHRTSVNRAAPSSFHRETNSFTREYRRCSRLQL
eukprot:jgi/Bigna1/41319/e_gw1.51.102.1